MRTAISLPDPLYKSADQLARRLGISRSELVRRALRRLVDEHATSGVTAALNAVYSRSDFPRGIDPELVRLQSASLPKESW